MIRTTIVINRSVLSDDSLACMAEDAVLSNDMAPGLWAVSVHESGLFDCSFMSRDYDPEMHNAIVNVTTG